MKKHTKPMFLIFATCILLLFAFTVAENDFEGAQDVQENGFSWTYLGTIAGATVATLLIVQYSKVGLDRVWKIPTRLYVYLIALAIVICAHAFTEGITFVDIPRMALNAAIVATSAYGSYELTYSKADKTAEAAD